MTTITRTWLSVSIASSQLRIEAMPTKQAPHSAPRRQPPLAQPMATTAGDHRPPRRVDEHVAHRVEHVDDEEVAERAGAADDRHAGAQVVVDPVDGIVDGPGHVEPPRRREVIGAEQVGDAATTDDERRRRGASTDARRVDRLARRRIGRVAGARPS